MERRLGVGTSIPKSPAANRPGTGASPVELRFDSGRISSKPDEELYGRAACLTRKRHLLQSSGEPRFQDAATAVETALVPRAANQQHRVGGYATELVTRVADPWCKSWHNQPIKAPVVVRRSGIGELHGASDIGDRGDRLPIHQIG